MLKRDCFYTLVKSYQDPFSEGLQYVMIIENSPIYNYDKRKNRKPFECDVISHSFHMNFISPQDPLSMDEKEFFSRLLEQTEGVKKKFDYETDYVAKIYGDNLVEVGEQLSKYTHIDYEPEEVINMCRDPYSR